MAVEVEGIFSGLVIESKQLLTWTEISLFSYEFDHQTSTVGIPTVWDWPLKAISQDGHRGRVAPVS